MHYLFLIRHYPPEISGGARRPFLMVKTLRKMGYRITVVTPYENDGEDQICVPLPWSHRADPNAPNPGDKNTGSTLRNHLRNWLLWPDPDIRWVRRVVKKISSSEISPDGIFTTSPPESIHRAGAKLAKKFNVPWVAEFRDTWFYAPHREILEHSFFRRLIEKAIARSTLSGVSGLTAVSDYVMKDIMTVAPADVPKKIIGHFSEKTELDFELPADDINLVHSGGFSLSDRRRLLPKLLKVIEIAAQVRSNLHLHIAGALSECEINTINKSDLKITYYGPVSLEQSQAMQRAADGLILFTPDQSHALPGKFAEYCFAQRPILYLGGGDWLNLVRIKSNLRPLDQGLINLQKGEKIDNTESFSVSEAAALLIELLYEKTLEIRH